MSIVNNDDSFFARKIWGESVKLFGNDHNEIKAIQSVNDHNIDSCFVNEMWMTWHYEFQLIVINANIFN